MTKYEIFSVSMSALAFLVSLGSLVHTVRSGRTLGNVLKGVVTAIITSSGRFCGEPDKAETDYRELRKRFDKGL